MEKITSAIELKKAIQLLEVEQAYKGELLREQFHLTYESLKPINILKNTLKEVATSPYLIDNILGSALGLASGYLTKKIFVGTSGNIIRRVLGSVLQFGITNVVSQHPDTIRTIGQFIFQHIFPKKDHVPLKEERINEF